MATHTVDVELADIQSTQQGWMSRSSPSDTEEAETHPQQQKAKKERKKSLAERLLAPLGLWVNTRTLNESDESKALPNGFPRITAFIASDPDHLASIYKRFDTLNVRNLLLLEARVAALEAVQQKLDDEYVKKLKEPEFRNNFALGTTYASFEYFAYLGQSRTKLDEDHPLEREYYKDHDIPEFVLDLWRDKRSEDAERWQENVEKEEAKSGVQLGSAECLDEMEDCFFRKRWEIAMEIKRSLKEYQDAIVLQDRMLKLYQPTEGTTNALQTWIGRANRNNGMDANRSDQFRDTSAAKNILADREDLVSLHPPGDNDLGTTIVALFFGKVLPLLRRRGGRDPEFYDVSGKAVRGLTTIFTFFVAMGFLIGAVWVIWRIGIEEISNETKFVRKLAVLTTFAGLFGAWVAIFTSAKRSEIFGATAAYAAVLIVFVGTDPNASIQP